MKNFLNKIFSSSKNLYSFKNNIKKLSLTTPVKKIFEAINSHSSESEIRYVGGCLRKILNNDLLTEKWWISPLLVLLGLLSFVVYSTWAAWQGEHFWWSAGNEGFGGYLSPFYSPTVYIDPSKSFINPIIISNNSVLPLPISP